VQQASDAIAKHLAHYLKNPRVRLTAMIPNADAARPPPLVQAASHTTTPRTSPRELRPHPVEPTPVLAPPGEVSRLKAVPQGKPLLQDPPSNAPT